MEPDLTQFGGIAVQQGDEIAYNFGVAGKPGIDGVSVYENEIPSFYQKAPNLQERWDGKTTICVHDAARKVLGKPLDAQMQPRGTCGGRAGKRAYEHGQCLAIASGRDAKFHKVSHAWLYALARKEYGMLSRFDGVPDGSIHQILAKYGALTYEEAGETSDYGNGSDDLAYKWGRYGPPTELLSLAADNCIKDYAQVKSAQELADAFASGGVGIVSGDDGFSMSRDSEGVCSPRGTWMHYHGFSGVHVTPSGRKVIAYDQSWGSNTPSGPLLADGRFPDWSFGVPWEKADEMCRNNTVIMLFTFELWDESKVIDWGKIVPKTY